MTIDLNADVGESFGAWTIGSDEALLAVVSSANVACGFHAGDPVVMEATVASAIKGGAAIGAHPGYPDLAGFGRRTMALSEAELHASLLYQIGALRAFVEAAGSRLRHVKPHGALYNDAAKDPVRARAIARAVRSAGQGLVLVGLPACELSKAAEALSLPYAREFFADRAYEDDGSLVARSKEGAVIHDRELCVERVLRMVEEGVVVARSGKELRMAADTVCLHGDNPEALDFALALAAALRAKGIAVRAREGS